MSASLSYFMKVIALHFSVFLPQILCGSLTPGADWTHQLTLHFFSQNPVGTSWIGRCVLMILGGAIFSRSSIPENSHGKDAFAAEQGSPTFWKLTVNVKGWRSDTHVWNNSCRSGVRTCQCSFPTEVRSSREQVRPLLCGVQARFLEACVCLLAAVPKKPAPLVAVDCDWRMQSQAVCVGVPICFWDEPR